MFVAFKNIIHQTGEREKNFAASARNKYCEMMIIISLELTFQNNQGKGN